MGNDIGGMTHGKCHREMAKGKCCYKGNKGSRGSRFVLCLWLPLLVVLTAANGDDTTGSGGV